MPRHLLLPAEKRDGPCQWPATGDDFVRLDAQDVVTNLVFEEGISPEGVANPWSPAIAFDWRLKAQRHEPARKLLRLLLIAQHLGQLEYNILDLGGASDLKATLSNELPDGVEKKLIMYRWQDGDEGKRPIAAGLPPRWPVFPSTRFHDSDGVLRLATLIAQKGKGLVQLVDGDIRFTKDDVETSFKELVKGLAQDHSKVGDGFWRTRLNEIAGTDTHVSAEYRSEILSLIPQRMVGEIWTCPKHESEGKIAFGDDRNCEITVERSGIFCSIHAQQKIMKPTGPVTVEDMGAAYIKTDAGAAELIIWADGGGHPNLRVTDRRANQLELQYGSGPKAVLRGSILEVKDIMCEPITSPPGPYGPSTIPIKARYLDLISGRATWQPGEKSWEVSLRGRRRTDKFAGAPDQGAGSESGVIVWPRASSSSWKSEIIGARLEYVDDQATVERVIDGPGSYLKIGPRRTHTLLESTTEGRVEYVAFWKENLDRGAIQIHVHEPAEAPSTEKAFIALDFGTSNSVVSYGIGDSIHYVQHGAPNAGDQCLLVCKGSDFPQSLEIHLALFSAWYETGQPSDLLGTLLVDHLDAENKQVLRSSVLPRESKIISRLTTAPRTRVHEDLKWYHRDEYNKKAVKCYIRRILLPAYHVLHTRGIRSVRVGTTFPLAFDPQREAQFKECVNEVVTELAQETGITHGDKVNFFSESYSGVLSAKGKVANYTLSIDMGGGTTDFAVLGPNDEVLAADSLEIGARKILRALYASKDQEQLAQHLRQAVCNTDRQLGGLKRESEVEVLVETLIQTKGPGGVVADVSPSEDIATRQRIAALLSAILLGGVRMLEVVRRSHWRKDEPMFVNVALLGQGWFLFDGMLTPGFSQDTFVAALKGQENGKYNFDFTEVGRSRLERKKMVAEGTLGLLRRGVPPKDETARNLVRLGLDLKLSDGSVVKAEKLILDHPSIQPATPDPGFEEVIQNLVNVMGTVVGPGFTVGDIPQVMKSSGRGVSGTVMDDIVRVACDDLEKNVMALDGTLHRSPLFSFLSNAWVEYWLRK